MLNRNCLIGLLCTLGTAAQGQYTIPDSVFYSHLLGIVPNALNAGVLDTNHADVLGLQEMDVQAVNSNWRVTDLDGIQFFKDLRELNCSHNLIGSLPDLPDSLKQLDCNSNYLTSLPILPTALEELDCRGGYNQFQFFPSLPNTLKVLKFGGANSQITSLPVLPSGLEWLSCSSNPITSLPVLPSSLEFLQCNNCQLGSLPELPSSLQYLQCSNNQLTCLPLLPNGLDAIHCFGNNLSCLPNVPSGVPPFTNSISYNETNIGFNPILCSTSDPCFVETITGKFFIDANGNGQLDGSEGSLLAASVAEAQPGGNLSGTDVYGNYAIPVNPGTYTVQGQPVTYHTITSAPHSVTILAGSSDTANHIGYQPIPGIFDLTVDIHSGWARPGFVNHVWLTVQNVGTETTTATIDLDFDADQSFVSSTVTPVSQASTNVNWSVSLNAGDEWNATVYLSTDSTIALGTPIGHLFSAIHTSQDTTPLNNSEAWNGVVVGSYDPNNKTASASSLTPTQVQNGEWIEYLIRFQNTGTFMAEHVRITDTLTTDLQWSTMEYISSSHNNYWYQSDGVLVFRFDNIQLPDSNSNEPASHGFVKFRIKPDPNLMVGESILNTANIYFDFNEPVVTDTSAVLIDVSSSVPQQLTHDVAVYPNPAQDQITIVAEEPIVGIALLDLEGREVASAMGSHGLRSQLSVVGLADGLYVLRVRAGSGIKKIKVIVSHTSKK